MDKSLGNLYNQSFKGNTLETKKKIKDWSTDRQIDLYIQKLIDPNIIKDAQHTCLKVKAYETALYEVAKTGLTI